MNSFKKKLEKRDWNVCFHGEVHPKAKENKYRQVEGRGPSTVQLRGKCFSLHQLCLGSSGVNSRVRSRVSSGVSSKVSSGVSSRGRPAALQLHHRILTVCSVSWVRKRALFYFFYFLLFLSTCLLFQELISDPHSAKTNTLCLHSHVCKDLTVSFT